MRELPSLASTNRSLNRSLLLPWCTKRGTKPSPTCPWRGSWLVLMTALWKVTLKRVSRWAHICWLLLCVTLLTKNLTRKAGRGYVCYVAFMYFCSRRAVLRLYQLRKARRKFGDQVLTFKSCCRNRLLAPFPVATGRLLTSLDAKREIVGDDTIGNG